MSTGPAGSRKDWKQIAGGRTIHVENMRCALIRGREPHSEHVAEDVYALVNGENPTPFSGNPRPFRLEISEGNRLKRSGMSGDDIRPTCALVVAVESIEAKASSERWAVIYRRWFDTNTTAMHWWLANEHRFREHYVDFWCEEARTKMIGQRVWWQRQPAIIVEVSPDGLTLEADGPRFLAWNPITEEGEELERTRCDLLDTAIMWGRELARGPHA